MYMYVCTCSALYHGSSEVTHTGGVHTHSPEEDVVYLSSDVCSQPEKLSIDAVEDGLEEVSLARVFAVKELKHSQHKGLVYEALGNGGLQLRGF